MEKLNPIDEAVEKARVFGNSVLEVSTGWSRVQRVIHMEKCLSSELRTELEQDPRLRYWKVDSTPHNRAEEGFTDDAEKESISFPR